MITNRKSNDISDTLWTTIEIPAHLENEDSQSMKDISRDKKKQMTMPYDKITAE